MIKRNRDAQTHYRVGDGVGYNPNLLKAAGEPIEKGQVIVGDITYPALQNGKFCYPATFQDKYTRRIVGWQVSERMTAQLVPDAFNQARRGGLLKKGAIIHQGIAAVNMLRSSFDDCFIFTAFGKV